MKERVTWFMKQWRKFYVYVRNNLLLIFIKNNVSSGFDIFLSSGLSQMTWFTSVEDQICWSCWNINHAHLFMFSSQEDYVFESFIVSQQEITNR